jgi:exosome complex component RRP45
MFTALNNIEKNFITNCLVKSDYRENGRDLESFRKIAFKKLDENGQVEVRLGETLIISQIFAKLVKPNSDRGNEGIVVFSIDMNHQKPNAEYTSANEDLNEMRNKLNNLLEKGLRESRALDTLSLAIVPGVLVWKIIVDINIINNDGNLYDACMLATLASWQIFKLPFLKKNGNKIPLPNANKPIQEINLSTLHVPLSVTFGLFDKNSKFLVDPSLKEEKCIDGIVIICANKFNEISYLHTYNSIQIDSEIMRDLLECVREKVKELTLTLKTFVEKHKVGRMIEKTIKEDEIVIKEANLNIADSSSNEIKREDKLILTQSQTQRINKVNIYELKN